MSAVEIARRALPHLPAGDALALTLPAGQPARRIAYQRIAAIAHYRWGAGNYRLWSHGPQMWVERRKTPRRAIERAPEAAGDRAQ